MPARIEMTGLRFGKLVARSFRRHRSPNGDALIWFCKCDCGVFRAVDGRLLRSGAATGCATCQPHKKLGPRFMKDRSACSGAIAGGDVVAAAPSAFEIQTQETS